MPLCSIDYGEATPESPLSVIHDEGEEPWTVAKLRELLEKHITALEMAGGELHPPPQPPPARSVHRPTQQYREFRNPLQVTRATAGELVLLAGGSSNSERNRTPQSSFRCIYCSQNHWSNEYPKYTTQLTY